MVERTEEAKSEPGDAHMSHLVMYGAGEGARQYILASSLDEAVAHAEYLVNERNNDSTRIFEMREVSIEYKRYYRVQVQPAAAAELSHGSSPDDGDTPMVVAVSA